MDGPVPWFWYALSKRQFAAMTGRGWNLMW